MRFAHLADCHIGSWRDPKLKDISSKAFVKAIDMAISKKVDFVLIAGDLFNTSLPAIERLKETVEKLKELKDKGIPVYLIAGSHDYSVSGKTMLDVLEKAGLFCNVAKGDEEGDKIKLKFTVDNKTGAKITGILGKKGGLEKEFYKSLCRESLESEEGYKIFMLHSAIDELKPESLKEIDSQPLSFLPRGFDYYAGGHPHYVYQKNEEGYGLIAYPGPLFPNNFKELEDLETGGFYIVDVKDRKTSVEWEPIVVHNVHKITIDAESKTPEQVYEEIISSLKGKELTGMIVTLRVEGTLLSGKPSDINFKEIFEKIFAKSAYFVMKNTSKLIAKGFEEIKVNADSVENIEASLIKEHLQQIKVGGLDKEKEELLVKRLMHALLAEKQDGENAAIFENRVKEEISKIMGIEK
jgi:DNA repair exonuclease SbcCD nuclease subunit